MRKPACTVNDFEGSEEDKKPAQIAFLAAMFVHVFILYVTFPEFSMEQSGADGRSGRLRAGPGPVRHHHRRKNRPSPLSSASRKTKKIPIPDPTPDEPEPIIEPEPEPEPEPLPPDMIALIGTPRPTARLSAIPGR